MRVPSCVPVCLAAAVLLAGCSGGSSETTPGTPSEVAGPADSPAKAASTPAAPDFEALPGAKAYFGTLERTVYRIEVPVNWNGELLLWAHGFRPEVNVESPPSVLRRLLVDQGYAWAASSFSENGFIPGVGTNDTLALKRYFAQRFGQPARTYVAGESMGGNVVVLSLENFPEEYDGGLSLCGVVAGVEWIDYLLAWAMAAEFLAGTEFPLDQGSARVAEVLQSKVLPALGPVEAPTAAGRAFESVVRNLTGGPRPFFEEGYRAAYPGNFGLVVGDPGRKAASTRAATTEGVIYRTDPGLGFDGDAINRGVRRLAADAELRDPAKNPGTAPTTGQLQDPLMTLHETGDVTVPISMEQSYRRKAEAAGRGNLLIQRVIRTGGHCQFSESEVTRAWHDLTQWVERGETLAGDDVLGDLADAGRTFTSPLRPGDPGTR